MILADNPLVDQAVSVVPWLLGLALVVLLAAAVSVSSRWVIGAGLLLALLVAPHLDSLLFGISSRHALTYAEVGFLLILAGAAAVLIPGWRATQVSPQEVLRSE